MTVPIRIAIFGSCVTRDVFNRKFSPNYKDLFDCVLLANQSTVVALMSPAIDPSGADLGDLDEWARNDVIADLTRSFLDELEATLPEYLLVDFFGDVHFGCAELESGIVTRNRWKTTTTPFYKATWQRDILPDSPAYFGLWRDASDRFVREVRARVPGIKIVLHEALNVTQVRGSDGELSQLQGAAAFAEMNIRWARLNAQFRELADASVDVMGDDTVSFAGHPWGAFAVHYELEYHARFLSRLTAIALDDARSPVPARPSLRQRVLGRATNT